MLKLNKTYCVAILLAASNCFGISDQAFQTSSENSLKESSRFPASVEERSRWIILSNDEGVLKKARNEVGLHGGKVIRNFEFKKGIVTHIPAQALFTLKQKFPEAQFIEDIEMNLIDPTDIACDEVCMKARGGGTKTPPQPTQEVPWGILKIQADTAHMTNRGLGVKVCVIDTGVDKTHPDLTANLAGGRNFIMINGRIDSKRWGDENGHGTHVAGTIAAADNTIGVVGVAPLAKIYAVRVLDANGSGSFSSVVDGINECVRAQAQVINMSLGAVADPNGPTGQMLQTAIDYAHASGLEVVVAAGNSGIDINQFIPSGLQNVIAVAAVDINLNFPAWTNWGLSAGDFCAPGVEVYSTWKGGTYNTLSGTSMASPHVAGVVALKMSAKSGGLVGTDLGVATSMQGSGLINALTTVLYVP